MKLLQMTDIHLSAPGTTVGGRDPNANFDRALSHALEHHPDADALFITGDLSEHGDPDDYSRLKERISALPLPAHVTLGNHDIRANFLSVFPELAGNSGLVNYTVPLPIGDAIVLDTLDDGAHEGRFSEATAAWMDAQLAALPGPVWIFLHHHPVAMGIKPMDDIMLVDADRFADTLRPHRDKIRHILHGHCHLPLSGSLLGIPFSAPRGTNHQGWPAFGSPDYATSDLPESYSVIIATTETTMIHMVEFGYTGEVYWESA
ncbi:MAG: metallophosphoesterase [Pseudomonadota bacterium]